MKVFSSIQPLNTNGNHSTFIIEWNLIAQLVKKWSRNRDSDNNRVKEMVEYYNSGGYIPFVMHLAYLEDEGLVCYKGNTRREVCNSVNNNSLKVIIDLMHPATQQSVLETFNNLSKSIQLPVLHLSESKNVKGEIITLVETYETTYPLFISTTGRCNRPHFNREIFIENVHEIYTHLDSQVSVKDIGLLLTRLNKCYSQQELCNKHATYTKNTIDKCKKYGLWLFLERKIPCAHIKLLHLQQ